MDLPVGGRFVSGVVAEIVVGTFSASLTVACAPSIAADDGRSPVCVVEPHAVTKVPTARSAGTSTVADRADGMPLVNDLMILLTRSGSPGSCYIFEKCSFRHSGGQRLFET
ncbi:hypothetical protein GCM10023214_36800 [Amycolatopsis dongchuanensis]|uniref:Secreted protein n=1 Tax=Amycolatopsis dongchuanensis TaxID=1070866 RepID=A0ABP9QQQ1_9PSEU